MAHHPQTPVTVLKDRQTIKEICCHSGLVARYQDARYRYLTPEEVRPWPIMINAALIVLISRKLTR